MDKIDTIASMKGLTISVTLVFAVFGQAGAHVLLPVWARASSQNIYDKRQVDELKARASKILEKAQQLAESENHSAIKAELVASLAIVWVKLGENEKGGDLLAQSRELIEEEDDLSKDCYECPVKEFFRILIAIDHAQSAQTERALEILEQVVRITNAQSGNRRGQLLAGLASVFAGVGNKERALQLLNEAFELSKTLDDRVDKAVALEEIVKRYAAVGQVELATRIAGLMEKGPFKDHALIAIAKKYAAAGQIERALKMNDEVETTNFKPDILTFVAKEYLQRGEKQKASLLLRRAVSVAGKITAENLKQFALSDAALLFAEAGQFDEALRILRGTDAQGPRLRLLTQLAPLFSQGGRIQSAQKLLSEAYQLAGFSKGSDYQARDIWEVAEAYAAIGKKERAVQLLTEAAAVLESLKDRTNKGSIFGDIAVSYLKLGEDTRALQTTERMDADSPAKRLTLLEIASKLGGAEQLMRKRERIVGELMRP